MEDKKFEQVIDRYVNNDKIFSASLTAVTNELKNRGVEIKSFDYSAIYLTNGISFPLNAWEIIKGMSQKDESKNLEETKSAIRSKIADAFEDKNYNL
jgi:hypothetical protein